MNLKDKRILFTTLLAQFILWVNSHPHWKLAYGEGLVAQTDARDGDYDGPHKKGGAHYTGLGHDMILYVDGIYIENSSHPVYNSIGPYWESMHELCRWGGRFNDANHFSLFHEGVA